MAGKRVVGRIRLSRLTDESTSAVRQRELIEQWSSMNEHTIVGWAEDLDVSGSVDPFDTPELGKWLSDERKDDFDVFVAWKLDRYGRDAIRLNKLFGWCLDNSKTLVSTSEGIDLSTPVGRLIANVIAFLAEGELEAIRERTRAGRRNLVETGRWPGGRVPYGLRPVELPTGGWKLEPHPEQAKVLNRIVDEIIGGAAIGAVVDGLNRDGVPTARGARWLASTVWGIIESKQMLGHSTYQGETVRDNQGMPVLNNSDPLLTRERWDALQRAIELRRVPETVKRTKATSPLLGVAVCVICGKNMFHKIYKRNTKTSRYYHCREKDHNEHIRADWVEELVEQTFLEQLGDSKVQERVYIAAESHQSELDEAVRAVDELTQLLSSVSSNTMRSRLTTQLSNLDSRIVELEKIPIQESRWEVRESPQTYGDAWANLDTEGRRQLLLKSGITAAMKKYEFHLRVPHDIQERLSK